MKCYPDSYFNSNDHATATRQEVIRIIGLSPPPHALMKQTLDYLRHLKDIVKKIINKHN